MTRHRCESFTIKGHRCTNLAREGHTTCGHHAHIARPPPPSRAMRRLLDPLHHQDPRSIAEAKRNAKRRAATTGKTCPVCGFIHHNHDPICSTWCAERHRIATGTPQGTQLTVSSHDPSA